MQSLTQPSLSYFFISVYIDRSSSDCEYNINSLELSVYKKCASLRRDEL